MQLSVSSFIISSFLKLYHYFLLFVNILALVLLLFVSVSLNLIFFYILFIRFVTKPHSSVMVISTPVTIIGIASHGIVRLGSMGFQLKLCNISNRVTIWFANFIFILLLFVLSVAVICLCNGVPSHFLLYLTVLVHLFSQRDYLLLGSR